MGGMAGGGKGAAIGAGVGAGAGGAVQVMTRGEQVRVPSETLLEFRLEQPVTVTLAGSSRDLTPPGASLLRRSRSRRRAPIGLYLPAQKFHFLKKRLSPRRRTYQYNPHLYP